MLQCGCTKNHTYDQQNPFELKEENHLDILPELIESAGLSCINPSYQESLIQEKILQPTKLEERFFFEVSDGVD